MNTHSRKQSLKQGSQCWCFMWTVRARKTGKGSKERGKARGIQDYLPGFFTRSQSKTAGWFGMCVRSAGLPFSGWRSRAWEKSTEGGWRAPSVFCSINQGSPLWELMPPHFRSSSHPSVAAQKPDPVACGVAFPLSLKWRGDWEDRELDVGVVRAMQVQFNLGSSQLGAKKVSWQGTKQNKTKKQTVV